MANIQNSANYEKLKNVLREVFQLDQADLDFGIYRIMNQKRNEINDFLEKRLLPQVTEILSVNGSGDVKKIEQELKEKIQQLKADGFDPDEAKSVKELRSKLSSSNSVDSLEQEVYSHLANFFKRYYKDGDFISLRRYKKDVYAIPYEGEEVKLHWANHDQYYIKTSEYLKNYGFKLPNGKSVKFELKEASTEQNNNKEQSGKERRFQLFSELPVEVSEDGNSLVVNFTYEEHDKKVTQDKLNNETIEVLIKSIPQDFHSVLEKRPTDKNKNRTLIEKHILDFTARNSFDYFIHKDLGGFLSRELDFYIKNEILYLDDINTDNEQDFTSQLSKVKAIKQVAQKIITFLAQLEDFQKKLWLKKKFVVSTNYCITLDIIPEKYYEEIANNKEQLREWKELFRVDKIKGDLLIVNYSEPVSIEFLKSQPYLIVDTKFFDEIFKSNLLAEFDNLDEQTNGILVNSENFQAINLLQEKFNQKLQSIYIDPPYNTDASAIVYKNNYKNSSWLSLMTDRIRLSKNFLSNDGIICVAIDDEEVSELRLTMKEIFESELGVVPVRTNPAGRKTKGSFAPSHEYSLFYGKTELAIPGSLAITEKRLKRYPQKDDKGNFAWANFIRSGNNDLRQDRPKLFYPIYVSNQDSIRIPLLEWNNEKGAYDVKEPLQDGEIEVYPINENSGKAIEKNWQRGYQRVPNELDEYRVRRDVNGKVSIDFKTRMDENSLPTTWWDDKKYASANYGASELKELFGIKQFDFPKAKKLVFDCLKATFSNKNNGWVIDFFAGSGTTGQSLIDLNRDDKGTRKFILVEMGSYFNLVTKPRVLKSIYSEEWKNGSPVLMNGTTCIIKYHDVESYEDVLNNLSLVQKTNQGRLLNDSNFNDEYILSYLLDVESRDSLLNVDVFKNPFNYKLNITRNNESQETVIDLVETFNYLIGLHVKTMQTIRGFKVITGVTNERDEETLIIWRNTEEKSNQDLNEFFTKMEFSTRDSEFQRIYVNGDNHLENLKTGDDNWKVVLIEEEFLKRMFDVQDV